MKKLNLNKETLVHLQASESEAVHGAAFTDRASALAPCALSNRYYTACYPCGGGGGGGTRTTQCPQ